MITVGLFELEEIDREAEDLHSKLLNASSNLSSTQMTQREQTVLAQIQKSLDSLSADVARAQLDRDVRDVLARLRSLGRPVEKRQDIALLCTALTDRGYDVKICSAAATKGQQGDYLRNLRHEFLECTALHPPPLRPLDRSPIDGPLGPGTLPSSSLCQEIDRATFWGGFSPLDSAVPAASLDLFGKKPLPEAPAPPKDRPAHPAASPPKPYLVDPWFREQFEVVKATPFFQRVLEAVPPVFCGPMDVLQRLVEVLAAEMALSFEQNNFSLPPWRQGVAQMSKWKGAGRLSVDDALAIGSGASTPGGGVSSGAVMGGSPVQMMAGVHWDGAPGAGRVQTAGNTPRSIERGFCVTTSPVPGALAVPLASALLDRGHSETVTTLRQVLAGAAGRDAGGGMSPPRAAVVEAPGLLPSAPLPRLPSDSLAASESPFGNSPSPSSTRRSHLSSQIRRSVDLQLQHTQSRFGAEANRHGTKRLPYPFRATGPLQLKRAKDGPTPGDGAQDETPLALPPWVALPIAPQRTPQGPAEAHGEGNPPRVSNEPLPFPLLPFNAHMPALEIPANAFAALHPLNPVGGQGDPAGGAAAGRNLHPNPNLPVQGNLPAAMVDPQAVAEAYLSLPPAPAAFVVGLDRGARPTRRSDGDAVMALGSVQASDLYQDSSASSALPSSTALHLTAAQNNAAVHPTQGTAAAVTAPRSTAAEAGLPFSGPAPVPEPASSGPMSVDMDYYL